MTSTSSTPVPAGKPTSRLRPEKRVAIMEGGRTVLAQYGIERASIDAIATASNVSTRTIYKHFKDKATLCTEIVAESAARVAEDITELIEKHLLRVVGVEDRESALIEFATAWLRSDAPSEEHRILMDQMHGIAAHEEPNLVEAWYQAGPGLVLDKLAEAFRRWDERELLIVPRADIAAAHFAQLISAGPNTVAGPHADAEERSRWIGAGVDVFLRAYRA
ncbi:TetR/AcrR family transcriptional regulator [Brevibacterium sp. FME37]|uniref:TetR/AcrR family transcriptional regulator n=1 Tax=Brevibacterium sp. FME37 TaxID=2742607 RepID=UPI00186924C5|nr:TetR/AcrR family transcriptional regulator [Brevibacterium sp. FME37]